MSKGFPTGLVIGLCVVFGLLGWVTGTTWGGDDEAADCRDEVKKAVKKAKAECGVLAVAEEAEDGDDDHGASDKGDPSEHVCNICGSTKKFKKYGKRKDSVCPKCNSKERQRLLAHYLQHETPLFGDKKFDVLHFAPDPGVEDLLRKQKNLNYVSADLFEKADLKLDITKIEQPDNAWDYVIVYHVLEHIVDDRQAMRELFRITRPGGEVILQVPLWPDRTEIYEDPTITDPKERTKAFGQHDHVRKYAAKGLQERLESVGFQVEPIDYLAKVGPELVKRHKFEGQFDTPRDQRIWVARKPATTADNTVKPTDDAKADTKAGADKPSTKGKGNKAKAGEPAAKGEQG